MKGSYLSKVLNLLVDQLHLDFYPFAPTTKFGRESTKTFLLDYIYLKSSEYFSSRVPKNLGKVRRHKVFWFFLHSLEHKTNERYPPEYMGLPCYTACLWGHVLD